MWQLFDYLGQKRIRFSGVMALVTFGLSMGCYDFSFAADPVASAPTPAPAPQNAVPTTAPAAQPNGLTTPTAGLSATGSSSNASAANNDDIPLADESVLGSLPRTTPFFSLLAPEEAPDTSNDSPQAPPAPTVNPFTGIELSGIMYRGNHSSAILVYGTGSKIVHIGDILKTSTANIKVAKIDAEAIVLQVTQTAGNIAPEDRVKRLKLPSIIGYHGAGNAPAGNNQSGLDGGSSASSANGSTSESDLPPELKALTKSIEK